MSDKKYLDLSALTYYDNKIKNLFSNKADLVNGKVPEEQLPEVNVITRSATQPTGDWTIWEKITNEDMDAYTYRDSHIDYEMPLLTIPSQYKYEDYNLTEVKLKEATTIGESAFQYCSYLVKIDANKCVEVGNYAFQACSYLTYINFNNLETIGNYAFYNCSSLMNLSFPNCETVGEGSFQWCYGLVSVDLGNCHSIDDYAFKDCQNLVSVTLRYDGICDVPYGVDDAFAYCDYLQHIYVPANRVNEYKSSPIWSSKASIISAIA